MIAVAVAAGLVAGVAVLTAMSFYSFFGAYMQQWLDSRKEEE